jgi:hypothetical protein
MECVAALTPHNAITTSGQLMFERLDAFRNLGHVGAQNREEPMPFLPPRSGVSDRRRSRPAK